MGKIVSRIDRPDPALVERYRRLAVARVAASLASPLLLPSAIKPLFQRELTFCGPAVTVQADRADLMMGVLATGVARAGDVIVVSTGGDFENACWGGGLTLSADNAGYAAVVLDGLLEDSFSVARRRTPVFCRGTTMRKLPQDGRSGSVNVDIVCGEVTISPGDLVLGDTDGVVVIPRGELEALIGPAEAMETDTVARIAAVEAAGAVLFDRWGGRALVEKLGVEWID